MAELAELGFIVVQLDAMTTSWRSKALRKYATRTCHTMGEAFGEHKRMDFFVRHLLGINPTQWSLLK
jgi:hypothetical protein